MATARKPSTPKTSADLKLQLAAAKIKLAELEKRAYAEELSELIASTSIKDDFARIKDRVKDIKPEAILAAIGEIVGIKRLQITQAEPKPRSPADPSKPKKPRAARKKS